MDLMNIRETVRFPRETSVGPLYVLLICLVAVCMFSLSTFAQSSTTGGLTGVVTDPSGAVISGATVTVTNLDTGETRTVTTDASGNYKFSLLPLGNYKVTFGASGFKTVEVPSVTMNVTETQTLNHTLEVGAQSEQVTVESTVETVQTQNATVGTVVGARTVTDLPLSSRNYTQIIDLSPGVVANVSSAAAVGNGTQDINVNGMGSDQNNYMMDGATVTNYGSGGGAQSGNFPGIGIPNPDAIQEFKIQTSQYDAEYGRNPGASVNVVTRGGTNQFHGAAWEFFRNTALDANDIFNKISEKSLGEPNKPEPLNENLFGGTFGGPIKKDKLFFFGSYQGFRQKNAVGTNGFATGLSTGLALLPFSEPDGKRVDEAGTIPLDYVGAPCSYTTYRSYLGCAFGGLKGAIPGLGTGIPVATNGSNINLVALQLLQKTGPATGLNHGFYIPSVPFGSNGLPLTTTPISDAVPTQANEDQYLGNLDWFISSKNTLSERFFTAKDPQDQSFVCLPSPGTILNSCAPGSPEDVTYTADSGTLKLTTVAMSNFVNEALISFQRATTVAAPGNYFTACSVGITPPLANGNCANVPSSGINPIPLQVPTISFLGLPLDGPTGYSQGPLNTGGNFFASATNYFNTFQYKDQISWNHGKHAIRAGVEADRIQYNWTLPGRGGVDFPTVADFLTSSSGAPNTGTALQPDGILVNFYGLGEANGNPHDQRTNEFSAFTEDDIKVTRKLTLDLGVRWEYDGYPSDVTGLFTNVFPSEAALVNTGSFFINNPAGTLAGFVVQSNYNPGITRCGAPTSPSACGLTAPAGIFPGYPGGAAGVYRNTNKTLVHGAPITDFGPRVGMAWQPVNKLVVRAGYGIFYDAVYANLLANNQAGNPPYNGYANTSYFANALDLPINPAATGGILGWQPRTMVVTPGTSAATGTTNITDFAGGNGLGSTSDNENLGVPLVQQYNLDLQYQVARNWVVDVGYVGSHGTHLYDWARPINIAFLAPNAPNEPSDAQNARMILGSGAPGTPTSFPFNDAGNTNPLDRVVVNTASSIPSPFFPDNTMGRVSYLGFGSGGVSTTNTIGDSLYNSLQAQLRHQFANGLLIQASYTWSKSITNINASEAGAGISAPGNVLSGGASSNDPLDLGQQYGLAAFNRPQRIVVAYSYDLPYKHTEGLAGHVLGGWTVSGVTTIQDGEPFTVVDTTAGYIYYGKAGVPFGGGGVRAELSPANTGPCNADGVCESIGAGTTGSNLSRVLSGLTGGNGWINKSAYTTAPCIGGTIQGACLTSGGATGFGNSGIGAIMGPGQDNWDISLIKNTKITEGTSLQFRAEFYNVWNHPQFNPPVNDTADATFGQIQSSSVPPRIMQFALKFLF